VLKVFQISQWIKKLEKAVQALVAAAGIGESSAGGSDEGPSVSANATPDSREALLFELIR